jgi:hypothetical protein
MTNRIHGSKKTPLAGSGKVDVRFRESTGKYRLRFYGVAPDQKDTILLALDRARLEAETQYDAVALEAICMQYLAISGVHKTSSVSMTSKEK